MEKAKVVIEKDVSLEEIAKFLMRKINTLFIGKKFKKRKVINELNHRTWDMLGRKNDLRQEVIKKSGFFTRILLNLHVIPKSSPYFFWYHLIFPTLQLRNKSNIISYNIDDLTVYRFVFTFSDGSIRIRCKINSHGVLDKATYRVVLNNVYHKEIDDEEEDLCNI